MIHLPSSPVVSLTRCLLTVACGLATFAVPAQEQLYGNYYAHDPSTIIKDGTNYYFCNDECKQKFDQNPQSYLKQAASPRHH